MNFKAISRASRRPLDAMRLLPFAIRVPWPALRAIALVGCSLVVLSCQTPCASNSGDTSGAPEDPSNRATTSSSSVVEWQSPVELASGPARKGPWRMNDSTFHYVDDPTAAFADDGSLGVAWVDNQRQNVFFQRYDAGEPRFDDPVRVSRSPDTFSWLPAMVIDGQAREHIYILWQEIVFSGGSHGGEAFLARSTSGGKSFEPPINLSQSEAGDGKGRLNAEIWDNGSLDVAIDPDDTLYVAWTTYEGTLWFRRSTDGGMTFDDPVAIADDEARPARAPHLAVGPDGTLHVAWTVGEWDAADIHLVRSTDRGVSFEETRTPIETSGHSDAPDLEVDRAGTLHLTWGESPGGRWGAYRVQYAQLSNTLRVETEPKVLASPRLESAESTHFPNLELHRGQHPFVIWEHYPDLDGSPRGLGWSYSSNGGDTFHPSTPIPGTRQRGLGLNGSLQGQLMDKLAVDDGRVTVVNSRFRRGKGSSIRWIRGSFAP